MSGHVPSITQNLLNCWCDEKQKGFFSKRLTEFFSTVFKEGRYYQNFQKYFFVSQKSDLITHFKLCTEYIMLILYQRVQ